MASQFNHLAWKEMLTRPPCAGAQYAYKPWTNFVRDCELFTLAPTCTAGEPCSKPVSASPWWLRSLTLLWRPVTYEYDTGIVPNKGDGWQYYADEGEVNTSAFLLPEVGWSCRSYCVGSPMSVCIAPDFLKQLSGPPLYWANNCA